MNVPTPSPVPATTTDRNVTSGARRTVFFADTPHNTTNRSTAMNATLTARRHTTPTTEWVAPTVAARTTVPLGTVVNELGQIADRTNDAASFSNGIVALLAAVRATGVDIGLEDPSATDPQIVSTRTLARIAERTIATDIAIDTRTAGSILDIADRQG